MNFPIFVIHYFPVCTVFLNKIYIVISCSKPLINYLLMIFLLPDRKMTRGIVK